MKKNQSLNKAKLERERKKKVASVSLQNDNYRLLVKAHSTEDKRVVRTKPNISPNAAPVAQRHSSSCFPALALAHQELKDTLGRCIPDC